MKKEIICIACSIFKNDIERINKRQFLDFEIVYIDSILHMYPNKLKTILDQQVDENSEKKIILMYGDCQPDMVDLENRKNVYRSPGINCCNIVIENSRYRKLRKEGAFILMDEWAMRWKEVFQQELGFAKQEHAQLFMQEMHTKLVYIDGGIIEIPHRVLQDISDFCGLPYTIEKSDPNMLEQIISDALKWFDNENR